MKGMIVMKGKYRNFLKNNPAHKAFVAANLCLDEWINNAKSDDENLKIYTHNVVLPKIALFGIFILCIIGIFAII